MFLEKATELDYWRYITKSKVSDLEAAFLVYGYLPIPSFAISNNSSRMEREIYEVYLYLRDGATHAPHSKFVKESNTYYGKLELWTGYLFCMDHPVEEALIQTFLKHDQIQLSKESEIDKAITPEQHSANSDHWSKILNIIKTLDRIFPDIPYKYYRLFPTIKEIVVGLNISSKTFTNTATKSQERPRQQGRPTKDLIDQYKSKFPNLKSWFDEILAEMEKEKVRKKKQ